MDFKKACEILELNINESSYSIKLDYLKKKYHRLALQNHPDKNGGSKERFQDINEAYFFLKREIELVDNEGEEDTNIFSQFQNYSSYSTILNVFIDGLQLGEIIGNRIKEIIQNYEKITIHLFDGLSKERSLTIYTFLSNYKNILHISDSILEQVREIIVEKYKNLQFYILNPSLDDLFKNNIYKLNIDGHFYFVMLWHNEMTFESKKEVVENEMVNEVVGEIVVKCVPELPDNVTIDEDNNLIVELQIPFDFSLFDSKTIPFYLGEKRLDIPLDQLYFKKQQIFVFKRMGISKIHELDVYNIEDRGDVIVKISMCKKVDPNNFV